MAFDQPFLNRIKRQDPWDPESSFEEDDDDGADDERDEEGVEQRLLARETGDEDDDQQTDENVPPALQTAEKNANSEPILRPKRSTPDIDAATDSTERQTTAAASSSSSRPCTPPPLASPSWSSRPFASHSVLSTPTRGRIYDFTPGKNKRPHSPEKNSPHKHHDRFITRQTSTDLRSAYNRLPPGGAPPPPHIASSPTRQRTLISGDSDARRDLANEKYAQLLSSELFPSQSDHDPFASSSSTTPPVTPSKPRTTRLFSTPTRTPPINGNLFGLSSPSHPSYATSPLKPQSLRALSFPPSTPRSFPKVPYKVLDAPDLQDDFYLNLVDWSKDCNMLGVALHSAVYTWNAETSHVDKLCDISVEHDVVTSISWVHNGAHLAIGTKKGLVQIWDAKEQVKVRTMKGHASNHRVGSLAWSSGSGGYTSMLASGSKDREILIRDVRSSRHWENKLEGHRQECCGLKFSPLEPNLLASGGNDNKLFVWDVRSARSSTPLWKFNEHLAAVKAIAWSPHVAGTLASGGGTADMKLRFWNTGTGAKVGELDTGSQVCNLAWSTNSNEIVSTHGFSSGPLHNQICIWKYPSLNQSAVFSGHTSRVLYLAMSPDGKTIVTGAGDETLRFWEVFPDMKEEGVAGFGSSAGVGEVIGRIR